MAEITSNPLVESDDGRWNTDGMFGPASISVSVGYGSTGPSYHSFFRFPSIDIPAGSTINSAVITFTASRSDISTVVNSRLYFNASDNAVAPVSYAQAEALVLSTAVDWNAISAWTSGSTYDTPDLAAILQEVIDLPGWAENNAVMLVWKNNGSNNSAIRGAKDIYNGGATALLTVTLAANYNEIVQDSFSAEDSISILKNGAGWTFNESASDGFAATDAAGLIFSQTLSDGIGIGDTLLSRWMLQNIDTLALTDTTSISANFLLSLLDSMFLYEELKTGWYLTNNETLGLTDEVSKTLGLIINEWLTLVDTQTNNWNGQEIVSESLSLYDLAIAAQNYSKTVEDGLGIADNVSYMFAVTVLELLGFTDLANAMKSITESVSESIDMTDSVSRGFSLSIADTLDIVDVHSVIALFLHTVQDTLGAEDTATLIKRLGITVNDPLVLTDTVSSQGTFYTAVYDTLGLNVTVEIAGEIWECYVLNTPKFYPSMYSGFDFNSFCTFEGRAFGANDTGVYELTGTTDAGATIHTGIILNDTDFGSPNQKRFRRGYLGISGAAPVMVLETEDGLREVYSIDDQGKTVFSSDQKSKSWKLSIADFNTLSSIKLLPVILTK